MYDVVLKLDAHKPWQDQKPPVTLTSVKMEGEAKWIMERTAFELQRDFGYSIYDQQFFNALQFGERDGDTVRYIGCVFDTPS